MPHAPPILKRLVPLGGGEVQEVRRFADSGVQASIERALARLDKESPDARSATLEIEKNPTGLNVAIVAKLNRHWSVAGTWRRDDWGDSLGTKVKFSW